MNGIDYLQVDVFADRRGGGNPLGVVPDARGWSDAAMQSFARWTNLVETTFVLPPSSAEADYQLRIFTPKREIPFAGHPSIGSAHALLATGRLPPSCAQVIQECGAGLLPIRIVDAAESQRLFVRSPAAQLALTDPAEQSAARALLPAAWSANAELACIQGGRRWWLAEFPEVGAVRRWTPDHASIAALALRTDTLGLCVFAREADGEPALVVRAFPAGVGIVEDPASGAANGLIATWLALREPAGRFRAGYRVSQGREMGHDARIDIVIEDGGEVWVGGRSNTIVHGQIDWDTGS